jgi:hypothetical protein
MKEVKVNPEGKLKDFLRKLPKLPRKRCKRRITDKQRQRKRIKSRRSRRINRE